ncbi:DUF6551 family protein [uncultured Clostridium sp.]|uniref:DUF6551 family protein n=1 Tax=uncultured Clostridium sp. TaxID=59620 RepID=UPI00321622F2
MNNNNFEYKQINSRFIVSDMDYQREVKMPRVRKIVANFNENLVNAIKVSYREGKYFVFDGQHTLTALKLKNDNKDLMVDCKVYFGLIKEDEAKLFSEQTGIHSLVGTADKFRALYTSGDIDVVEFRHLTESIGLIMDFTKNANQDNRIVAYSKAFKIFNWLEEEEYLDLLDIIKKSWDGEGFSFSAKMLGGMYEFYKAYKNEFDKDTLIKQLSKISTSNIKREAEVSLYGGDKRYARQILMAYNKKLRKNRLEDKFN